MLWLAVFDVGCESQIDLSTGSYLDKGHLVYPGILMDHCIGPLHWTIALKPKCQIDDVVTEVVKFVWFKYHLCSPKPESTEAESCSRFVSEAQPRLKGTQTPAQLINSTTPQIMRT